MEIEIFKANSQKWKSISFPDQLEMTTKEGGLILTIRASDIDDTKVLSPIKTEDLKRPKGVTCKLFFQSSSEDRTGILYYQVYNKDGSFAGCLEVLGMLIVKLGEMFKKLKTSEST